MINKLEIIDNIISQGMLPLYYHDSSEVSVAVNQTLYRAGIRVIEYTNRGDAALENFKTLKKIQQRDMPGLLLGIGTIKTARQANEYVEAGADFIISPIVSSEVAAVAAEHDLMWIPGCMTPTEIHQAQQLGATLVKLFPANILGPAFVAAVKELFPGLMMMPTGGVEMNQENISGWFKAGVSAVGMGSKLITKTILADKAYEELYAETLKALALIQLAR